MLVSTRTGKLLSAFGFSVVVAASVWATPLDSSAQKGLRVTQPLATGVAAQLDGNAPRKAAEPASFTSEQRARAVRASLRAALTPDPLSMGALLFCAFALRWMKSRKDDEDEEQQRTTQAVAPHDGALPGAA